MALRVGNIASGEDFFDRVLELKDLWGYLEGNHISLTGPRRLGKSSLLKRLSEEAVERDIFVRLVDVQGCDSALAFVEALESAYPPDGLRAYAARARNGISNWMSRLQKFTITLPGDFGGGWELQAMSAAPWSAAAKKLQERLTAVPLLFLIDEFSVFLERLIGRDPQEAVQLLSWLRAWRLSESVCRFVFSGSVGINSLLERHRLGTWLNDCYEYKLGPFRLRAAQDMLITLAGREAWAVDEGMAKQLCDKVGWLSPFYLILLLDETMKAGRDRLLETAAPLEAMPRRLVSTDIDDAYDRLLAVRSRFIHWYQRLRRDIPNDELDIALAVLSLCAKSEKPMTRSRLLARLTRLDSDALRREERLSTVLAYLEEHGYLGIMVDGHIGFLSFLLRDYWKRNHAR